MLHLFKGSLPKTDFFSFTLPNVLPNLFSSSVEHKRLFLKNVDNQIVLVPIVYTQI